MKFKIKDKGSFDIVDDSNIIYLEADSNYCNLFYKDFKNNVKKVIFSKSLNVVSENLPDHFVRVHRSFVVNTNLISRIDKDDCVVICDRHSVPYSEEKIKDVINTFNDLYN